MPNNSDKPILKPNANRRNTDANWNSATNPNKAKVAKEGNHSNENKKDDDEIGSNLNQPKRKRIPRSEKHVAIDCEMVGIGFKGQDDMLARVSIVNRNGKVLLDKYVKPREAVTDYRTAVSGIRPSDLVNGEEFNVVQDEVVQILQNRVLVGHNVKKDLQVLQIKHPFIKIRDTSSYKPLCRLVSNGRTPSLKRLSELILGVEIQTGEHNSVEDARAAMNIYKRLSADWEQYLRSYGHNTNRRKR